MGGCPFKLQKNNCSFLLRKNPLVTRSALPEQRKGLAFLLGNFPPWPEWRPHSFILEHNPQLFRQIQTWSWHLVHFYFLSISAFTPVQVISFFAKRFLLDHTMDLQDCSSCREDVWRVSSFNTLKKDSCEIPVHFYSSKENAPRGTS